MVIAGLDEDWRRSCDASVRGLGMENGGSGRGKGVKVKMERAPTTEALNFLGGPPKGKTSALFSSTHHHHQVQARILITQLQTSVYGLGVRRDAAPLLFIGVSKFAIVSFVILKYVIL